MAALLSNTALITALALLVVGGIGTAIGWFLKARVEEASALRTRLNDERRKNYSEIVAPFIAVIAQVKRGNSADKTADALLGDLEQFQRNRLDLALFGSDNVVRAHNAIYQYAYTEANLQRGQEFITLWGRLLLEIRRDVGNKKTILDEKDMLRWLIQDIDRVE